MLAGLQINMRLWLKKQDLGGWHCSFATNVMAKVRMLAREWQFFVEPQTKALPPVSETNLLLGDSVPIDGWLRHQQTLRKW